MERMIMGAGLAVTGVVLSVIGAGIAGADAYAGQKYSDASEAAAGAGYTPVIVTRNGDGGSVGDCVVERSQKSSFMDSSFSNPGNKMLFYLNCDGPIAEPGHAGNSAASVEGRAELARRAEQAEAARQQNQQAELADTNNAIGVPGA